MLGKELKRIRVDVMDKTLADISKSSGFAPVYLSEIERGLKIPRNGCTLKKLSVGYNVHFDKILEWFLEDIKQEGK
jgi:transcriptional regulator with XRE-family HTH domain